MLERFGDGIRFLIKLAEEKAAGPAHVAIALVRSSPGVACPLVGASRLAQLEDSLKAFDLDLTPEEREAIAQAFGAEVKEEAAGQFPELRRELYLTKK